MPSHLEVAISLETLFICTGNICINGTWDSLSPRCPEDGLLQSSMLLTFSRWGYWLPHLGTWLVSLGCNLSCVQCTLKIMEEGKKKSSARVKGGVNHCDFQIGKRAYSRFRENWGEGNTSPSCTLVFFLLELVSPFHVDYCSQPYYCRPEVLADLFWIRTREEKPFHFSTEAAVRNILLRGRSTEQDSWFPHTDVHLQDGHDSPSLNLLWLPNMASNFSKARNPLIGTFSWRRFLVLAHTSQ